MREDPSWLLEEVTDLFSSFFAFSSHLHPVYNESDPDTSAIWRISIWVTWLIYANCKSDRPCLFNALYAMQGETDLAELIFNILEERRLVDPCLT